MVNKNSEDITSHNLNTYRSYDREYIQPIQTSCKSCDPANQEAKNQDNFIESLPYPFNILEFKKARSCKGKCWLFHMNNVGVMHGYLFPSGYRLSGLKRQNYKEGCFFIECRNFHTNTRCLLSAMIEKTKVVGSHFGTLTLTNGLFYSGTKKQFEMYHHTWRGGRKIKHFKKEVRNAETIRKYVNMWQSTLTSDYKFVYLNELFKKGVSSKDHHVPIQCDINSPDIWCEENIPGCKIHIPLSIKPMGVKSSFHFVKQTHSEKQECPDRFFYCGEKTVVYLAPSQNLALKHKEKYLLIPYSFDNDQLSFVPIKMKQYKEMMAIYKNHGVYSYVDYRKKLRYYKNLNDESIISVIRINGKNNERCIVALCDNIKTLSTEKKIRLKKRQCNYHSMEYLHHPTDFELPHGVISIFRGYSWPFKHCLNNTLLDLIKQTYKQKGLLRSCTVHSGNFEMIGPRRSFQSNGSLIVHPKYLNLHQYSRESMNTTMLPYAKKITNGLQSEAIYCNYTSGESLMSVYRYILKISNPKDLCAQTIVTQNNFCNSVHTDNYAILDKTTRDKILNSDYVQKKMNEDQTFYLQKIMEKIRDSYQKAQHAVGI